MSKDFLRDNINIWVLFTLRVSLLELNHYATFANSLLKIFYRTVNWVILNTYRCVVSKMYKRHDITWVDNIIDVDCRGMALDNQFFFYNKILYNNQ